MKLTIPQKQMQFAPIPVDDSDELSRSIEGDPVTHDDNWNLHEEVDSVRLNRFLNEALTEFGPDATDNSNNLYK